MANEPDNLVLELLRGIRAEIAPLRDLPAQVAELRSETTSLRTELGSEIMSLRTELGSEITSLRTELRSEITSLRTELRSEITSLRTELRSEITSLRMELGSEITSPRTELRSEITSLRADVASDFLALNAKIDAGNKATRDQIVGLRGAVIEYHSAVIGHGMLISELEARVRRMEQHLNLPSMDAH